MTTQKTLDRALLVTLGLSLDSANIVMEEIEELRSQLESTARWREEFAKGWERKELSRT